MQNPPSIEFKSYNPNGEYLSPFINLSREKDIAYKYECLPLLSDYNRSDETTRFSRQPFIPFVHACALHRAMTEPSKMFVYDYASGVLSICASVQCTPNKKYYSIFYFLKIIFKSNK